METMKILNKQAFVQEEKYIPPEKKEWKKAKEKKNKEFLDSLNQCDKEFKDIELKKPIESKKVSVKVRQNIFPIPKKCTYYFIVRSSFARCKPS